MMKREVKIMRVCRFRRECGWWMANCRKPLSLPNEDQGVLEKRDTCSVGAVSWEVQCQVSEAPRTHGIGETYDSRGEYIKESPLGAVGLFPPCVKP